MKKLNTIVLCLFLSLMGYGQLTIDDTVLTVNGQLDGDKFTFETYLHNNFSDSIQLEFKLLEYDMPGSWYSQICTNLLCFSAGAQKGYFNPIGPGEASLLIAYVYNDGNTQGTGTTKIVIYDTEDSLANNVTVSFVYTAQSTGISAKDVDDDIVISPNPVNNIFNINLEGSTEKYDYLDVYDRAGKLIRHHNIGIQQKSIAIEMSDAAEGMYLVRLKTNDGHVSRHKIIKQ